MANIKILVVDDEPVICLQFTQVFTRAKFVVKAAASAEEALKIMAETPMDILFLDLNLPGMNGIELCREVRQQWPWCIPIAVTGYASVFQLLDCREAGFEDYFIKPVSIENLQAAASHAVAKIERWRQRSEG